MTGSPPSVSRLWPKLLLSMGSVVLVLIVAELGLRVVYGSAKPREAFAPLSPPPDGLAQIDSLFDLARPHTRGLVSGALFHNNSAGFRGPERSMAKPKGIHRTVVVGDSFTMGDGVTYEQTYSHQLERMLERTTLVGPGAQVLNLGVSGLNSSAVIHRLAATGARYRPDLVVYGYTLNDVEGPEYRKSYDGSYGNPRRFHQSSLSLVRLLGPKVLSFADLLLAPVGSYANELDDNYFRNATAVSRVKADFQRMVALSRRHQFCPVVFLHTRLSTLSIVHAYRRHYDFIEQLASAAGAHVIQSIDAFAGMEDMPLWVRYYNQHPNAKGHAIMAEALHEGLAKLPKQCLRTRR